MTRKNTNHVQYPLTETDLNYVILGKSSTKLYGYSTVNGHYVTSTDGNTFTDRTYSPVTYTPNQTQLFVDETNGYMYMTCQSGKLYRAAIDVFNVWVDVSPPNDGTTNVRADIFAFNGTYIFYGTYNDKTTDVGKVYRSSDNGATWTTVLTLAGLSHIHAVLVDPTDSTKLFVATGDSSPYFGLWYSASSGDSGSFVQLYKTQTNGRDAYPINIVLQNVAGYKRILGERDGNARANDAAFIYGYDYADLPNPVPATEVVPVPPATSGNNWNGSVRGICLLSNGDLFFVSTSESGAITGATRDALWYAVGPTFEDIFMVQELTGGNQFSYAKSIEWNGWLFFGSKRFELPVISGR